MNILEGATLYLDHKPLKGNPSKHFGILSEASKQGRAVGFTQARPPRLIATLFTDLVGEEALSDKLLELLTAEVTPTLILDGPSGLSSYYLVDEALEEGEWQQLSEAVAKQYGGTPAVQEEILPLPGFSGTTLLHASDAPLTRNAFVAVFPAEEAVAAQPASVQPHAEHKDPQALREAIETTDLPALVAHHYPESGAKPGVESAVKAVWRGDENPSFSLFRSKNGGAWLYRDHGTGEKGNAFGFLVDILQLPRAEAAEALKGGGFIAPRTPAPVRQTPEKVKLAVKRPTVRSRIVKTYAYTDESYNLLFEVVRFTPKRFAQRRKDPETGAWVWGLKEGGYIKGTNGDWIIPKNGEAAEREFPACRHVLFHLPKVVATASSGDMVYLVEGEKDVETLEAFDLIATCNPMGARKWDESYTETLRGRRVVNLRDNDEAGEKHAAMVAEALRGETSFTSVLLPGLPTGGDVMDEILTVAQNEGGSLARHLAVYIDEFAHVGRLEDAGSWFGTMRSYNIAFTVALQNRAQLELVYGTVGAKAMEGGNFQHLITFPASLRGDDKEYVSRLLGEVTAEEVTTSVSRQHLFDLPRRTTTRRRVARPLLSREEMDKWDPDYGVLLPHGAGPTKIAAPMIQQKRVGAARNRFYRFRNDVGAGNSLALVESLLSRHKLAWLTEHPPEPKKARDNKPVAEENPFVFTETLEAETPAQPKADKEKGTVAKADEPGTPRPAQVVSAPDAPPPARKKASEAEKTPEQKPSKQPDRQAPASAAKLHLVPNGELMPSFRAWVEGLAWQNVPLTVYRVREGGRDRVSKVLFDRLPGALRHEHLEHWKQRHWLRIHRGKLGIVNHGCTVLCPAQLEAFMASPRAQVVEIGEGSERVVVKARAENARTEVVEHGEKRDEATLTLGTATASRTGSSVPASREDPSVQAALRAWVAGDGFRLQGHPSHDLLPVSNGDLLGRFFPETVFVAETYLRGLNDFPDRALEAFSSVGQKKTVMREIPGSLVRRLAPLKRLLGTDAHLLENHPACKDKEQAIGRYQEQGVFLLKSTATEVTGISFDDTDVSPRKIGAGDNKRSKRVVYLPIHPEPLTAPAS